MGRRGPAPKPIEMRNAEGGTAKRGAISHRPAKKPVVLSQRVVDANQIAPLMPLSAEAQKMWDTVVPELMSYNAATVLDAPNLTVMCLHWGDAVELRKIMVDDGRYDLGSTGQLRRSPIVDDYMAALKEFNRISAQYGLTLDARTRLALTDVTTRSLESDLNARLGPNPRRTNRTLTTAKREIEKGDKDKKE